MSSHETGPCIWITRENWEQHGADYDDYCKHVRRWL